MKKIAHDWFNQWKDSRGENVSLIDWIMFDVDFIDMFFPHEIREPEVEEFMNTNKVLY